MTQNYTTTQHEYGKPEVKTSRSSTMSFRQVEQARKRLEYPNFAVPLFGSKVDLVEFNKTCERGKKHFEEVF